MLRLLGRRKREEQQRDELLSAYLDGELGAQETQRLEARLAQDPTLRAELRALRQTVSLVQALPQVGAPRNLILTKSMVERRQPAPGPRSQASRRRSGQAQALPWAAPLLTAATAVVSLLFAVVLAGDLLLPGIGGLASAPESMEQSKEVAQYALEAGPADEDIQLEREVAPSPPAAPMPAAEAPLEEPETAVEEKAAARTEGEGEAAPSPTPAWAIAAEAPADGLEVAVEEAEEPAEEERAAEAMLDAETPAAPMGGGGPTEEPVTLAVPTAQQTAAPVVVSGAAQTSTNAAEAPQFAAAPAEGDLGLVEPAPSEIEITSVPIHAEERTLIEPARGGLPWRVIQAGLGLTAVVLAFATIRAWRTRRR